MPENSQPSPTAHDADSNVSFTLSQEGRTRLIRVMDALTANLPRSSAVLTDTSGRVVDVTRKPLGVDLSNLSALAAGCHATTRALAAAMGESESTLVFEHEDDQRVCVWPVDRRALLVALLRDRPSVETLEERLQGPLGHELRSVILEGREPMRNVPPPRVVLADVPPEVRTRVRALTVRIMNHQDLWAGKAAPATSARLLKAREELVQALRYENWPKALDLCAATERFLEAP